MRRRHALLGLCCACTAWPAGRFASAETPPAVTTVEVVPGMHVRHGLDEDATAANRDAIANIGFVIGGNCVAVLDAGGSLADGLALRARIRALTEKPVRYVILSHVHPDHVFGAAAFRQDDPVFIGHAVLPDALRARGDFYRQNLEALLGTGQAGEVVVPQRLVTSQETIDLGGRLLQLRAHPVAHTDCDLSTLDLATGTLFSGDLLFVNRIPSLDGNLRGWLGVLEAMRTLPATQAVPGHGPVLVPWPAAAADELRYLRTLQRDVTALVRAGGSIEQAEQAAAAERSRWTLFDDYNGRNATEAFKEIEWE